MTKVRAVSSLRRVLPLRKGIAPKFAVASGILVERLRAVLLSHFCGGLSVIGSPFLVNFFVLPEPNRRIRLFFMYIFLKGM